jgi:hypothetical protein
MSEQEVGWWPNWYVTRLHAVLGPWDGHRTKALCGADVEKTRKTRLAANPPQCAHCRKKLGAAAALRTQDHE